MRHRLNVWLGCSVSDQDTAEQQIPHLLKCRDLSPCLFVSYEPATGPVQFRNLAWGPHGGAVSWLQNGTPAKLELVIVGGESGPNARPCNIEWIRDTVQQCEHAGVACFVKQVGSNAWDYDDGGITGNEADVPYRVTDPKGGNPDEWPEYIQVRQIPETTQGSSR